MMRLEAVCTVIEGLSPAEVRDWIARGWVVPAGETPESWTFQEADVARVRLVRDLRFDAGIEPDSLAVVLSLLDQITTLRQALTTIVGAVADQPDTVRRAILTALRA